MKKLILVLIVIVMAGFYPMYSLLNSSAVTIYELFGIGIISCIGAFFVADLTRRLENSRQYRKYLAVNDRWQARFGPAFKRMAIAAVPLLIGIWIGSYNSDLEKYGSTYAMVIVLILMIEACIGVMLYRPASFLPTFYGVMAPAMTIIINYKFLNSDISLYIIAVLGSFVVWKNNQIKEYMVNN